MGALGLGGGGLRPLQRAFALAPADAASLAARAAPRASDGAGAAVAVSAPLLAVRISSLDGPVVRDPHVSHPLVRVHLLDATTGRYLRVEEPVRGAGAGAGAAGSDATDGTGAAAEVVAAPSVAGCLPAASDAAPGAAAGAGAHTAHAGCIATGPCINRTFALDAAALARARGITLPGGASGVGGAATGVASLQAAQSDNASAHVGSLLWGEPLVFGVTLQEAMQPNVVLAFEVLEPERPSRLAIRVPRDVEGYYRVGWGFMRVLRPDGGPLVDVDARVPLGMPLTAAPSLRQQPPGTVVSQSQVALHDLALHDFVEPSWTDRCLHVASLPSSQPQLAGSTGPAPDVSSIPSPEVALQMRVMLRRQSHATLRVAAFGCIVPATRYVTTHSVGTTYAFRPPPLPLAAAASAALPPPPLAPMQVARDRLEEHPLLGRPLVAVAVPTDVYVARDSQQGAAAVAAAAAASREADELSAAAAAAAAGAGAGGSLDSDRGLAQAAGRRLRVAPRRAADEASFVPSGVVASLPTARYGVTCVSFSPDGRVLAASCVGESDSFSFPIRLFETQSGTELVNRAPSAGAGTDALPPPPPPLDGVHGNIVYMVSWSPCSQWLVSASGDGTCVVWHVPRAAPAWYRLKGPARAFSRLSHVPPGFVYCARFHPRDSRVVITGSYDHGLRLWDARTGEAAALQGARGANANTMVDRALAEGVLLGYIGAAPEGSPPAAGSADEQGLFAAAGLSTDRHRSGGALSASSLGALPASVSRPPLSGASPAPSAGIAASREFGAGGVRHEGHVNCIEFDDAASGGVAAARRMVTCDSVGVALVWELAGEGGAEHVPSSATSYSLLRVIAPLAFRGVPIVSARVRPMHSGAPQLLLLGHGNLLRLFDLLSGRALRSFPDAHCGAARLEAAFSPDGEIVATGSDDGALRLWAASTGAVLPARALTEQGQSVTLGYPGSLTSLSWSPSSHSCAIGAFGAEYPVIIIA